MKHIRPFPIIVAATLGLSSLLTAQDDEDKVVPDWQMAFENLGATLRTEYNKHIYEASRLFNQKRIIESLNEVAEAEKIFDQGPAALNLLGACHVEFRSFRKARIAFEKALALQKQYLKDLEGVPNDVRLRRMRPVVNILFNIAEMDFVTGQWQDCHDRIEKMLPKIEPKNVSMIRLIEFKYMLCKLKIDREDEARKLAEKYDYLDDNPFYYYANSALAYFDKKEADAERWRASARRIFRTASILAPWEDTMIEYGYVKSFYGGVEKKE